jgi:hypothetical protein
MPKHSHEDVGVEISWNIADFHFGSRRICIYLIVLPNQFSKGVDILNEEAQHP